MFPFWFSEVEEDLTVCKFLRLIDLPAFWKLGETSELGYIIISLFPKMKYLEYIVRKTQTAMLVTCQGLAAGFFI